MRVATDESFSVYDRVVEKCKILDEYDVKYIVQATLNQQFSRIISREME